VISLKDRMKKRDPLGISCPDRDRGQMNSQMVIWVQQEVNQTANYSYSFKVEWVGVLKVIPYLVS
jgi:hypothetical protein